MVCFELSREGESAERWELDWFTNHGYTNSTHSKISGPVTILHILHKWASDNYPTL